MEHGPKSDAKGKAALIIAAMKPKETDASEHEMENGDDDMMAAKEDAASSMMSAMKSNDAKAFVAALEDFLSCSDY